MNPQIGWALAALGTALGYWYFGWRGVLLAASAMVFWLLLQFSRALRAMRTATSGPIGHVPSAVMLHSKLQRGQRLMDVITLTRSLGQKLSEQPEAYAWTDDSGARVEVSFDKGLVSAWTLTRPDGDNGAAAPAAAAPPPAPAP